MTTLTRAEEERAEAIHREAVVFLSHWDILLLDIYPRRRSGETHVTKKRHINRMKEGGVTAAVVTTGCDLPGAQSLRSVLQNVDAMNLELDESDGEIVVATSAKDVAEAKKNDRAAFVLGIEGGRPLEGDLALLRTFQRLGLRCIGFTWNYRNELGDGVGEGRRVGLSDFGVRVVEEMNRLRMVIDLSHASKLTFTQALECSKDPVIASHSNAMALWNHRRNLDDEQIHAIAEKGGVIGINFWPDFLGSNPTVEDILNHIDYISDLVGVDHVGLGPDYVESEEEKSYMDYLAEGRSPRQPFPSGIEDITKLKNVTRGLVSRGYSNPEIKKILGENLLRVFREVIGE